jgi:hypothetical protein
MRGAFELATARGPRAVPRGVDVYLGGRPGGGPQPARPRSGVLSRLADYPESGRVLPEFPDLAFREVIVAPYRFFYRVKEDAVWVVAAWHSA